MEPPEEVLKNSSVRIIWIPMWEGYSLKRQRWWNMWKQYSLKFVSFSRRLTEIAHRANIPVFDLQYYDDPSEFASVPWDQAKNVFYWNRAGLLTAKHLYSLCSALQIEHLYYKPKLDYYMPATTEFALQEKIGKTSITTIGHFASHEEYLAILAKVHIYIAPRWFEGIGLTITEAMASGAVVLANDAPTMNEYVVHGKTGIFLPYNRPLRYLIRAKSKIEQRLDWDQPAPSPLIHYNWEQLLNYDLPSIGAEARAASELGRKLYMDKLSSLVDFFFDWP